MKDKYTIENILTDNTNLDMETLEKINDTCCALSDKQKDRILDIINQKTIDKEQTKDILYCLYKKYILFLNIIKKKY